MRFQIINQTQSNDTLEIKSEVVHNPALKILEEFLFNLRESGRSKVAIDSAITQLKKWSTSKFIKQIRRIISNVKKIKHLRSFFSFSSCINNLSVQRRILLRQIKRSPEEEGTIGLVADPVLTLFTEKFILCY